LVSSLAQAQAQAQAQTQAQAQAQAQTQALPSLPNFLVFLVDDMGYSDLGCYGSQNNSSPNIDQLAAEGLRFTQWMSAASVCTPSRAALQTGRLARRFGMTANVLPWRLLITPSQSTGLPASERTVATELKELGYRTGMSGKWHLGVSNETTQWAHLPPRHGYDSWLGTSCVPSARHPHASSPRRSVAPSPHPFSPHPPRAPLQASPSRICTTASRATRPTTSA
jgi:arylsulfatase A-like enzyme